MIEPFEYKGFFWLPEDSSEKIYGILKYEPEEGTTLDLIGSFPLQQDRFNIILGNIESNNINEYLNVTLYNSFVTQRKFKFPPRGTSKIFANFVLIGPEHLDEIESLKFQEAIIYLKHFDEWINESNCFKIINEKEEITIKYNLPKEREITIKKGFILKIKPTVVRPSNEIFQKEAKIIQQIKCVFSYSSEKKFEDILNDIGHFEQFLTLCSQRPTQPIEFYLLKRDTEGNFNKKFDVYHQVIIDKKDNKNLTPDDFLVHFGNFKESFNNIINEWYSSQEYLGPCYVPFFYKVIIYFNPPRGWRLK